MSKPKRSKRVEPDLEALEDFIAMMHRPGWKLFVAECSKRRRVLERSVFNMFLRGKDEISRAQAGIGEGLRVAIEVVPQELAELRRRAEQKAPAPEPFDPY